VKEKVITKTEGGDLRKKVLAFQIRNNWWGGKKVLERTVIKGKKQKKKTNKKGQEQRSWSLKHVPRGTWACKGLYRENQGGEMGREPPKNKILGKWGVRGASDCYKGRGGD